MRAFRDENLTWAETCDPITTRTAAKHQRYRPTAEIVVLKLLQVTFTTWAQTRNAIKGSVVARERSWHAAVWTGAGTLCRPLNRSLSAEVPFYLGKLNPINWLV